MIKESRDGMKMEGEMGKGAGGDTMGRLVTNARQRGARAYGTHTARFIRHLLAYKVDIWHYDRISIKKSSKQ